MSAVMRPQKCKKETAKKETAKGGSESGLTVSGQLRETSLRRLSELGVIQTNVDGYLHGYSNLVSGLFESALRNPKISGFFDTFTDLAGASSSGHADSMPEIRGEVRFVRPGADVIMIGLENAIEIVGFRPIFLSLTGETSPKWKPLACGFPEITDQVFGQSLSVLAVGPDIYLSVKKIHLVTSSSEHVHRDTYSCGHQIYLFRAGELTLVSLPWQLDFLPLPRAPEDLETVFSARPAGFHLHDDMFYVIEANGRTFTHPLPGTPAASLTNGWTRNEALTACFSSCLLYDPGVVYHGDFFYAFTGGRDGGKSECLAVSLKDTAVIKLTPITVDLRRGITGTCSWAAVGDDVLFYNMSDSSLQENAMTILSPAGMTWRRKPYLRVPRPAFSDARGKTCGAVFDSNPVSPHGTWLMVFDRLTPGETPSRLRVLNFCNAPPQAPSFQATLLRNMYHDPHSSDLALTYDGKAFMFAHQCVLSQFPCFAKLIESANNTTCHNEGGRVFLGRCIDREKTGRGYQIDEAVVKFIYGVLDLDSFEGDLMALYDEAVAIGLSGFVSALIDFCHSRKSFRLALHISSRYPEGKIVRMLRANWDSVINHRALHEFCVSDSVHVPLVLKMMKPQTGGFRNALTDVYLSNDDPDPRSEMNPAFSFLTNSDLPEHDVIKFIKFIWGS